MLSFQVFAMVVPKKVSSKWENLRLDINPLPLTARHLPSVPVSPPGLEQCSEVHRWRQVALGPSLVLPGPTFLRACSSRLF